MASRFTSFLTIGCVLLVATTAANGAAIDASNAVAEPRIYNSEQLISTIVDNCFTANAMYCLKEKVLTYLDNVAGIEETVDISGRAYDDDVFDKVILDRVARILNTNEIRVQLPETIFANSVISYRADRGFDMDVPRDEARGEKKKDKLILPLLLLMKLKLKVIMPIIMSLIGLKAFKALILSKIAIKLVLGFLLYNLIQKLGGMKMSMTPMMPAPEYGPPPPSTTASSYDPSSWEPMSGGPYARWDSHNIAYSSYQPSSSSSYSSGSSSGSGSSSSYSSSS